MKKKEDAEAVAAAANATTTTTTETKKTKKAAPPTQQKQVVADNIPKIPDTLVAGVEGEGGNDDEVMYGAPDDVVWSDKSNAQRQAEEAGDEDPNKVRKRKYTKEVVLLLVLCV